LDWELNVEPSTLKEFEDMVRKDFAGPGPYPTYVLQTISKLAATSTNPFPAIAPNSSTSPIPSFGLIKRLHQNQRPLPHQYPQTPQKHTSHPPPRPIHPNLRTQSRRHCQDRLARVLPRHVNSGAGCTRFCRDAAEDVRIP